MTKVSVKEFINLCSDAGNLEFRIFDIDASENIFEGVKYDCPSDILGKTVLSFDAPNLQKDDILTINISLRE